MASASPSRIPGSTPAASAAAVTGPSSGSEPGSGASAAGPSARRGRSRSAARSSNPGNDEAGDHGNVCSTRTHVRCQEASENYTLKNGFTGEAATGAGFSPTRSAALLSRARTPLRSRASGRSGGPGPAPRRGISLWSTCRGDTAEPEANAPAVGPPTRSCQQGAGECSRWPMRPYPPPFSADRRRP